MRRAACGAEGLISCDKLYILIDNYVYLITKSCQHTKVPRRAPAEGWLSSDLDGQSRAPGPAGSRLPRGSSHPSAECIIVVIMTQESLGVDDSLLESAAQCLDAESVRALGELQLADAAKLRLDLLAEKANEGQLTAEEAHEYDRFIELGDIIATLRLKAERQKQFARG
jgi:hypothetical protein